MVKRIVNFCKQHIQTQLSDLERKKLNLQINADLKKAAKTLENAGKVSTNDFLHFYEYFQVYSIREMEDVLEVLERSRHQA